MNEKQATFAREYIIDLNATQAAIRAGYAENTAYSQGQRLLKHVEVAKAIELGMEDRARRTGITQDRVLQELAKIGFSDIRKALTPDGNVQSPHDWDDDTAAAIASFEVVASKSADGSSVTEHVHKFKTWDKLGALDKLARHVNLYAADPTAANVTVNVGVSPSDELQRYIDGIAERRGKTS
jgi:phage terminase small subunit